MHHWRALLWTSFCMFSSATAAQRVPLHQAFDLNVPWSPQPVLVNGEASLMYELHLTSYAAQPLGIERIDVLDDAQHVLLELVGSDLTAAIGRADRVNGDERLRIAPGMSAVAYLSVPWGHFDIAHLHHRVVYTSTSADELIVEGGSVKTRAPSMRKLGPPLRGGPWVAIYDARWERGHRRVLYAVNGSVKVPGRFAIDWILLGPHGGFASDKGENPTQWYGYGADVLAVADATVAAVGQGVAEPATLKEGAARKVPLEDAAGNYIALNLGDGRYAFYEHLKPGSITVKPGQRVRPGEVIGKLGFTGESTGPHLHFHVSDANAPLDAEGLPYALSSWRMVGAYTSIEDFAEGKPWTSKAMPTAGDGFPAPLSVVDFGNDR